MLIYGHAMILKLCYISKSVVTNHKLNFTAAGRFQLS